MLPKLTLYLHTPFCVQKCPYCAFNSIATSTLPEKRYLSAICQELQHKRQELKQDTRPLSSLYFGGGTPSLLAHTTLQTILSHIQTLWPLTPDCEITLEANPESATLEKMVLWRNMGINRLSLGIQAFDSKRLTFLERPHTLKEAHKTIENAQQAGFHNFSLDLIYATPGHTQQQWQQELLEALSWQPKHISCYQLTIEKNTPFFKKSQTPSWNKIEESLEIKLFQQTRHTLSEKGYFPYEISNFSKKGFTSVHNVNYWSFGDYLGIGCSAHGKITNHNGKITRSINPTTVENYMTALEDPSVCCLGQKVVSTPEEAGQEYLLMGLRHSGGVDCSLFQKITGQSLLDQNKDAMDSLVSEGFLIVQPDCIKLSEKGILMADSIALMLTKSD